MAKGAYLTFPSLSLKIEKNIEKYFIHEDLREVKF